MEYEHKTVQTQTITTPAWHEFQEWLMMNVGSKEAEECLALVEKVIDERAEQHANKTMLELWHKTGEQR